MVRQEGAPRNTDRGVVAAGRCRGARWSLSRPDGSPSKPTGNRRRRLHGTHQSRTETAGNLGLERMPPPVFLRRLPKPTPRPILPFEVPHTLCVPPQPRIKPFKPEIAGLIKPRDKVFGYGLTFFGRPKALAAPAVAKKTPPRSRL